MHAIRNEPDVHPSVAEAGEEIEASLTALVDAAVGPFELPPAERAVVRAMVDLGTWEALRDQGLEPSGGVRGRERDAHRPDRVSLATRP